jgi:serine/threonine-protein kinase
MSPLEQLAGRLQVLREQGEPPGTPVEFKQLGAASPVEVAAILRADQCARWRAGDRIGAEEYLALWTALRADKAAASEIVFGEFLLREELGEAPRLEEFEARFPHLTAPLRRQIERYRRLASSPLSMDGTSTEPDPPRDTLARLQRTTDVSSWPVLPGYAIEGVLGRGAMGIVYRARQLSLDRTVALKMILDVGADQDALARFRNEAMAIAQLQHPNIVQIHELGEHGGRPFLALEHIEGGSLSRQLAGTPQPPRAASRMVELLARAVHFAHQRGIVHRDLKPGNVLLTYDGAPKLTDFGLAKHQQGQSMGTQAGAIMGTPSYMAPEQAAGRNKEVGPASDTYALGAILYEMLTGRPPFRGSNCWETLQQIQTREPVPPTHWQAKVPRDLESICLKCLEKRPSGRYASAQDLAEDLHRFMAGEPIQARRATAAARARRWMRQRPVMAVLAGLAGLLVLALLVGAWWFNTLAASALLLIGLSAAAWWHHVRLERALCAVEEQRVVAERSVERLQLLLEATHELMGASDPDQLLRLISETSARLVNAERATVFLVDQQGQELYSRVALGEGIHQIRIPVGAGLAGTVAATGEIINTPDAYADPRFNPVTDRQTGYRTRNLLTLPMKDAEGRVFGVFQVLNKRGCGFDNEDVEILGLLARSVAVAVGMAVRSGCDLEAGSS